MLHLGSGQRDSWEFEYSAKDLARGATQQKEFRLSRVVVWTKAKEDLLVEVKEKGITITDSVAASLGNYATSAMSGPSIGIDPQFQKKLAECHSKIQAHTQAAAEYDGWVQVLEVSGDNRYKLNQADWLYFFGKI